MMLDLSNVQQLTDEDVERIMSEPWYLELQAEAWEDFVQGEIEKMWDYLTKERLV